jgi:hypothetical protein
MYHMKTASIRELRYGFKEIERFSTRAKKSKSPGTAASLLARSQTAPRQTPDFMARLRAICGDKVLAVSGAELTALDRGRY